MAKQDTREERLWQAYTAASSAFASVTILFIVGMISFRSSAFVGVLLVSLAAFSIALPLSVLVFVLCLAHIKRRVAGELLVIDVAVMLCAIASVLLNLSAAVMVIFLIGAIGCLIVFYVTLRSEHWNSRDSKMNE